MDLFIVFMIWLFAPTFLCILLACLLSLLRVKPPKPRRDGWFGPYQ